MRSLKTMPDKSTAPGSIGENAPDVWSLAPYPSVPQVPRRRGVGRLGAGPRDGCLPQRQALGRPVVRNFYQTGDVREAATRRHLIHTQILLCTLTC